MKEISRKNWREIKNDYISNDLKSIKIQFSFGHIVIIIKNNKIFVHECEIYIPINYINEKSYLDSI